MDSKKPNVFLEMYLSYRASGCLHPEAYELARATFFRAEAAVVVAEAQKWANQEVVK